MGAAPGSLWRKLAGLCLLLLFYFVVAMQLAVGWVVVETWFLVIVLSFLGDSSSNSRSVLLVVVGQRLGGRVSPGVVGEVIC